MPSGRPRKPIPEQFIYADGRHSYTPPAWRWGRLIESLGTYQSISDDLVARGYPRVPISTLAGWRLRNSLPPFWVPVFIDLALERKIIVNIEDLRERNK